MGFVESKVRLLATSLEKEGVAELQVWPKPIPSSSCCCRYKFNPISQAWVYSMSYQLTVSIATLQMACRIQGAKKYSP